MPAVTQPKTADDSSSAGCRGKYRKAASTRVKNVSRKSRQQSVQGPSANANSRFLVDTVFLP
jgi:hypothetical protein